MTIPFPTMHKMPFGEMLLTLCALVGLGSNEEVISIRDLVPQRRPQNQGSVDQTIEIEMDEDTKEILNDLLKITDPNETNPQRVPVREIPSLRKQIAQYKPTGVDGMQSTKRIMHFTTTVADMVDKPPNDFFPGQAKEVSKNINSVNDIWFAIQFLFAVRDKIGTLLSLNGKEKTGMPAYYLYIGIFVRWACKTYIQNKDKLDFVKDFKYAIAHGNSIMHKRDLSNKSKKRPNDSEGNAIIKKGKTHHLTQILSGSITHVNPVPIVANRPVSSGSVNQEAVNQEAVNQEAVNQQPVNQQPVNQQQDNSMIDTESETEQDDTTQQVNDTQDASLTLDNEPTVYLFD